MATVFWVIVKNKVTKEVVRRRPCGSEQDALAYQDSIKNEYADCVIEIQPLTWDQWPE